MLKSHRIWSQQRSVLLTHHPWRLCWGERGGGFLGDEEGIFKQISWKRLNVNSITWEGLQRAESWPELELQRQGTELCLFSPRPCQLSFEKCKSLCVCVFVCVWEREWAREEEYWQIHGHPAGACYRWSRVHNTHPLPSPTPTSSTNHVHGLSWGLSWPLRTMIHLCTILINHISLTQPPNSVERLAPRLTCTSIPACSAAPASSPSGIRWSRWKAPQCVRAMLHCWKTPSKRKKHAVAWTFFCRETQIWILYWAPRQSRMIRSAFSPLFYHLKNSVNPNEWIEFAE